MDHEALAWLAAGAAAGLLDYAFAAGFGLVASLILAGLLGEDPRGVAAAAAIAQIAAAAPALVTHRRVGNLDAAAAGRASRPLAALAVASTAGALAASFAAARLDGEYMALLYAAGLLSLAAITCNASQARPANPQGPWRPGHAGLAALYGLGAGAYKAIVGGGYSALLVLAQRNLGVEARTAIALTPIAKLPAFIVVAIAYTATGHLDLQAFAALTAGALVSLPLAAYTLRKVGGEGALRVLSVALVLIALARLYTVLAPHH